MCHTQSAYLTAGHEPISRSGSQSISPIVGMKQQPAREKENVTSSKYNTTNGLKERDLFQGHSVKSAGAARISAYLTH